MYEKQNITENTDMTPEVFDHMEDGIKAAHDNLSTHQSDYVRQIGYGTTAGSANTYTLTLNPALIAYTAGVGVTVKINVANTGASTLNVNGLGAKSILDSKGNAMTSGKLRLNGIYTLRYDGTNFILQGEGGDLAKLPNWFKNGDFSKGDSTGVVWSPFASTKAIASNVLSNTGNGTAISGGITTATKVLASGKKEYFIAKVRVTNSNCTQIRMRLYSGTQDTTISNPIINQWYTLSGIVTGNASTAGGTYYELEFSHTYADATTENGKVMEVKEIMNFKLTDAYGAGNEPSQAEIDAFVLANGGWWDSDLTVLTNDATAVAVDIVNGKSAYVNGVKLDGANTNKKWANGTGTDAGNGSITISGLSFTPTRVKLRWETATNRYLAVYDPIWDFNAPDGTPYEKIALTIAKGSNQWIASLMSTGITITASGFTCNTGSSGVTMAWEAFE